MTKLQFALVSAAVLTFAACSSETPIQAPKAVEASAAQSSKPIKPNSDTATDVKVEQMKVEKALAGAPSGTYVLDKGHGYITFHYDHQGYSRPYLRWRSWDSTLNWNAENPTESSVSVSIDAASIDSGVDKFDDHLKSADFFNIEEHPTISFQSTSLTAGSGLSGTMTGNLSMMGLTKPVTMDVTFNKAGEARGGGHKVGFSATTQLLRSEWNLGKYVPFVGDAVDIVIEVEYDTPKPE